MSEEAHPPGSVVLVPFPFTDLSGRKRRPALVVSPEGFHDEDLILCAITSQLPRRLSGWEVPLEAEDMVEEKLPKKSIVKVGKLFHHAPRPHSQKVRHGKRTKATRNPRQATDGLQPFDGNGRCRIGEPRARRQSQNAGGR